MYVCVYIYIYIYIYIYVCVCVCMCVCACVSISLVDLGLPQSVHFEITKIKWWLSSSDTYLSLRSLIGWCLGNN